MSTLEFPHIHKHKLTAHTPMEIKQLVDNSMKFRVVQG